jgi:hypothetical protein
MQKVPHPSEAQSNTVNRFDCCSRGNSVCKCISFLVHISVQMHNHVFTSRSRGNYIMLNHVRDLEKSHTIAQRIARALQAGIGLK